MTVQELEKGLSRLRCSYPAVKLDDGIVMAYSEALLPLSGRDFEAATKHLVVTVKFFPSVSEIVEEIDRQTRLRIERADSERRKALPWASPEVIGEQQRRFKDLISGKIPLPDPTPNWKKHREAREAKERAQDYGDASEPCDDERGKHQTFVDREQELS